MVGAALAGLLVASCGGSPTVMHLVAAGDPARVSPREPESDWTKAGFADGNWLKSRSPVPVEGEGRVLLRQRFDVGADAPAFKSLDIDIAGASAWRAWLNGVPLGPFPAREARGPSAGSGGPSDFTRASAVTLPEGLLRASDNTLAIEAKAPAGTRVTPTVDGAADATAGLHVTMGPWLQRPRPDGITVVFETSAEAAARVIVDGRSFDAGAGRHHVAEVRGLLPSRSYRYHIEVAGIPPVASDESELATAPAPGAPVVFAVWGDHRTHGDEHRRGAQAVLSASPDFIVDVGDLVDAHGEREWRDFFAAEYSLLRRVPMHPVLGDHEYDSGGAARYAELFPVVDLNNPGGAYGIDYGAVHVAVLNSNKDLDDQARWLDGDLAAARARGATALFLATHHGVSSGVTYDHGVNDEIRDHVLPVARKHGVVALFAGHDHFYERGTLDGVRYVVSGGGGAPLRTTSRLLPGSERLVSTLHHVVLRVSGAGVRLQAVTPDGAVIDDAVLR